MNRSQFLYTLGGLTGSFYAMGGLPLLQGCSNAKPASSPFGIQLYTLRQDMPNDPRGVLKQLADFGYHQIESYEGPMGMFWDMSPAEFKSYMDDLGMEIIASHCNVHENFERKAAEAASIDMKYLISPGIRGRETLDDFKKAADLFNTCGEICRKEGLRFAYHNHAYSFQPIDGVYPHDLLMDLTDPALVDFELDIYWLEVAGENTIEWLKKYPNRFVLSHVKDMKANVPAGQSTESVTLGTGSIDFPAIFNVARENGMKYFIVEQESYEGTTPLESARDNAEYMRNNL